ncbi:MAG TPA: type II toxin-antitoxin system prevent-host-death family antitoxin [Miltoncostaeaceae bacterium]|jgi:prevent-host-death family protein|nr:type II toxin-antitoxin system prevent-host-death family antitoxin [Miltoncostaeaceae bacterium]
MKTVGVRALKQNASAVVAEAASGETVIITDRGEPVAQMLPLGGGLLRDLERAGLIRKRRHSAADLPAPLPSQASLGDAVRRGRDDERY